MVTDYALCLIRSVRHNESSVTIKSYFRVVYYIQIHTYIHTRIHTYSITNPNDKIYNECVQINPEETNRRLLRHLLLSSFQTHLPIQVQELVSGSISVVYIITLICKLQYVGIDKIWERGISAIHAAMKVNAFDFGRRLLRWTKRHRELFKNNVQHMFILTKCEFHSRSALLGITNHHMFIELLMLTKNVIYARCYFCGCWYCWCWCCLLHNERDV